MVSPVRDGDLKRCIAITFNYEPNVSMQSKRPSAQGVHEKCLKVLHITDCHLSAGVDGELLGVNTRDSLDAVLARVAEDAVDPDYVMATGDLAQEASEAAYQHFKQRMSRFSCPVSWFPGNHDTRDAMRSAVGAGDELQKVKKIGGWQFILLDSLVEGKVHGWLEESELQMLDRTLADNPGVPTIVSLHHHPIDIECRWLDRIGLHNRDEFLAIIDKYEQVKLVLWGHIHQQFEVERKGVPFMATPSTCIQFKPRSDDFAIDEVAPGYRWLRLYDDGRIETEVIRAEDFEFQVDMESTGY